jgi:hypothetical protein
MRKSKAKPGEKICLMKAISTDRSGNVQGHPYRVIAVPEGFTLYRLAEAIVDSFGFYFDHPFGFYDNIRQWTKSKDGYELFADIGEESEFKGVERTKVGKVFHEIKKKMLFLFDYGDEWHFIVKLEGIESLREIAKYPLVVESVGDAPPQYGEPDEEDEF